MSLIQNIEMAELDDGGEGAFYIYLKKNYKMNLDKSVSLIRLSRFFEM